jgi:hypothetical protein
VARIREETRDEEEIADFMLGVFRDKSATRRDRMEAARWRTCSFSAERFSSRTRSACGTSSSSLTALASVTLGLRGRPPSLPDRRLASWSSAVVRDGE